jgi:HSP20 family molecular chaperone IbpA
MAINEEAREKLDASPKDGVLTVILKKPRAAQQQFRRIKVQ